MNWKYVIQVQYLLTYLRNNTIKKKEQAKINEALHVLF